MKAIHKETGEEFLDITIAGPRIKLVSKLGNTKEVSQKVFKSDYTLKEGNFEVPHTIPKKSQEEAEAEKRAQELLKELWKGSTIVRIPAEKEEKKTTKEPTKKTPKKPKESGTISLKDICDELKVDPAKARRIFRKENIDKPYEWSNSSDINKIKGLLK